MSINQLILRNLRKNFKNYYLYVFALLFSVALYFAFVTLQYDPAMDATKGTIKGAAAIRTASILLVTIVAIFVLYANTIFLKRRSKEIGLLQLIGMTKGRIFRILSAENLILYFSSLLIGILIGFSTSKLLMMILFKITKVDTIATLHFSNQALVQTITMFTVIYLVILMMNYFFIKKQSILSLFRLLSTTEHKAKKLSSFEMFIGIAGMALIIVGYYVSSKLFGGSFTTMLELFGAMLFILASVIIGTYLFYKGSVSFIFHLVRKKKNGYLKIHEVLSLSTIMFRMKASALLLTIITTVSALAISLLSLSYISYYSAEKTAENQVAGDFSFANMKEAEQFTKMLEKQQINYVERQIEVIQSKANLTNILGVNIQGLHFDPSDATIAVINDKAIPGIDVHPEETVFTGFNDLLQKFMAIKDSGQIELKGKNQQFPLKYIGLEKKHIVSWYFTNGGFPVAIVDDAIFTQLKADIDPAIQKEASIFIGVDIKEVNSLEKANLIFQEMDFANTRTNDSRLEISNIQKKNMGLIMFIVGFLGLTFLITSGCILYFKQMGECEEEKPNYTILRKLGFTQADLLKGVKAKQLFNFGIPLIIGLCHSYFAVQSGWFLFGTELWTPMIIVMILYTALYSIFGLLSVRYYKKVIKEAL
ncbi:MAG TPA: ABC transporter permease [Bacillus bacterium]|nr:ABC transporter permease [Bacillus sp. (in: firmicutes)]